MVAAGGSSPASVVGVVIPTQAPSGIPPPAVPPPGVLLEISSSLTMAGGPWLGSRWLLRTSPSLLLWDICAQLDAKDPLRAQ